jgi:hypothetical protein
VRQRGARNNARWWMRTRAATIRTRWVRPTAIVRRSSAARLARLRLARRSRGRKRQPRETRPQADVVCVATTRTAHGTRLGQQHSEEGGEIASDRALYRTHALPSPLPAACGRRACTLAASWRAAGRDATGAPRSTLSLWRLACAGCTARKPPSSALRLTPADVAVTVQDFRALHGASAGRGPVPPCSACAVGGSAPAERCSRRRRVLNWRGQTAAGCTGGAAARAR